VVFDDILSSIKIYYSVLQSKGYTIQD